MSVTEIEYNINYRRPKDSPFIYARLVPYGKDRHGRKLQRGNWRSTGETKKLGAKRIAEGWINEARKSAAAANNPVTTLEEAYHYLSERQTLDNVSDATVEVVNLKASHVTTYFGRDRDIQAITLHSRKDAPGGSTNEYLMHRRDSVKDPTIAKEMTYLIAALSECAERGLYQGDPAKLWPPSLARKFPGRKRWLPFAEFTAVLAELRGGTRGYVRRQRHGAGRHGGADQRSQRIEHAAGMGRDWSDEYIVYTFTGQRLAELYRLRPEHVTADHVHIPGTKTDGAVRTIPLSRDAAEVLHRRKANIGPDGFLFPITSEGKTPKERLDNQERAWLRALRGACKRAAVAHASTNDLRRTFCTWC
ncbi:MAG TPA: tyrosine-type recombinase/integrase, partial [Polyangiales bacterium]|nr:tyrosine-type recombinase/integrase [Polyangiales bacterium]